VNSEIKTIEMAELPSMRGNKFYLDYLSGENSARDFITHSPTDFAESINARKSYTYPRKAVAELLHGYNTKLGAGDNALSNCKLISYDNTHCVITGQQIGFMGGPLYSLYKIITAIRLAEYLQEKFKGTFIPVFWGATEDHDFHEINHAHHIKDDGEVGKVSFSWNGHGKPISDLDLSKEVYDAYEEYKSFFENADFELTDIPPDINYSDWKMGIWSKMFADQGLVVVTPEVLRPQSSTFFKQAFKYRTEIRSALDKTGDSLVKSGYKAMLSAPEYGSLYTFDDGYRVRVGNRSFTEQKFEDTPELFSSDAALRPLLADSLLPVCASVLGPGEVAYQATLKTIYKMFNIPQPVLFPRLSYTVLEEQDQKIIEKYKTDIFRIISGESVNNIFSNIVPDEVDFVDENEVSPLDIPEGASAQATKHYKNEQRIREEIAVKRRMKRKRHYVKQMMKTKGYTKGEVQRLRNRLFPKNGMQERILPMPHFYAHYGEAFIDTIFNAGELCDFSHKIVTLEQK